MTPPILRSVVENALHGGPDVQTKECAGAESSVSGMQTCKAMS